MTPTDLLILVLATAHAIEVFHHSSIFAGTRAWLEGYDNFIGDLFACAFCLSLWVGTLLACIYYFAGPTVTFWRWGFFIDITIGE